MKKLIKKTSLKKLFKIPNGHVLTKNDIRYHGSLIPNLKILREIKLIDFKVTLKSPNKKYQEVLHNNSVNTHIFKPKYFQKTEEKLVCYVSSREVLAHTLRSLAFFSNQYEYNDIQITAVDLLDKYHDFLGKWPIRENVLIARVESVINFLRMVWLIDKKIIKKRDINKLFKEIELSRLKIGNQPNVISGIEKKYLKQVVLSFAVIDKDLKLKRYKSKSPYIEMADLIVNGSPVSIVQLPWGYSMSVKMMKFLLNKNKEIKKVGIVGGIGYLGKEKVKIDDVFVPKNLIKISGHRPVPVIIENEILNLPETNYLFKKRLISGNIYSVRPRLGKLSYTKHVRGLGEIHAYDMEKEAILKLVKSSKIKMASCYYVMDFPYTSQDLGGTYYSYEFLQKLFSKNNRGKYYCFERILHFLIN